MNKIDLDKLSEYDEVKVSILVKKGTKVEFEKGNMLFLIQSPITKEESGVFSAKYLGKGRWEAIEKIALRKANTKGDE